MDKFELLRKYKELFEDGIIEKEEFEAKKREILESPEEIGESVATESQNEELSETNEVVCAMYEEVNPDADDISEEEKEKQRIYDNALMKAGYRTSTGHKEAIDLLESLEGWKDSDEEIERLENELPEILDAEKRKRIELEEKRAKAEIKKAKRKKRIKKLLIGFAILIAIIIVMGIIGSVSAPNIGDVDNMTDDSLHSMDYQIPEGWKSVDESSSVKLYSKTIDGELVAIMGVTYKGEEDLSGSAKAKEENATSETATGQFETASIMYDTVSADNSLFEVAVYAKDDTIRGKDDVINAVIESFDTDGYENPREVTKTKAKYSGATTAGTRIDGDCDDITVKQYYDTGVAKGYKVVGWSSTDRVKLKAGKTSTFTLKVGGKTKKVKIKCTTLSKAQYKAKCKKLNYKNQLRHENNGSYIKIEGNVLQDCGGGYFRISSNGSYDDVYMVYAEDADIVEDDWVVCYGVTTGIYSYETVLGATQKVPSMTAKYVVR